MITLPLPRRAVAVEPSPYSWRFLLTMPVVYLGLIPFALLDLFLAVYQRVCFPAWNVPLVRRREYLLFDRARLPFLNWHQRINCYYCSYANGLAAYLREIAARTEQYWCPLQHESAPPAPHSRYPHFLPFGNEQQFKAHAAEVSSDFSDVK